MLALVVSAGSVLEKDDQRGLAHFVEHMTFDGKKHFPKNEMINMRFGDKSRDLDCPYINARA
jgi:predicted Zn-dependent peptidase